MHSQLVDTLLAIIGWLLVVLAWQNYVRPR